MDVKRQFHFQFTDNASGQKNTFDYWKPASKTEKWIEITEDASTYKFRVKAYRTVKGKKYYGLWSDEFTLKEKIGDAEVREIIETVCAYGESYAKKNGLDFTWLYMWDRPDITPDNAGYFVQGAWPGFSRYSRKEDMIKSYKERIKWYMDDAIQGGGSLDIGLLYIKKLMPGEGFKYFPRDGEPDIYYCAFVLY